MELPRVTSRQKEQGSSSVMLKQIEQSRMRSLTSMMASARANASSRDVRKRWKARRDAVFGPIPGSFDISSIKRATGIAETEERWFTGLPFNRLRRNHIIDTYLESLHGTNVLTCYERFIFMR